MFAKVVILCATLVAVNAQILVRGSALAQTGTSATSRHQDSFGNYAFGYNVVDGYAATKSQFEVGDAYGNKESSYSSHINHVAPVAVARPAAPLAVARHVATLAVARHAVPHAVAHHAVPHTVAHHHAAPLPVAHHAAPLRVAAPFAVAHATPLAVRHHAAPLAIAHAAPVAYSTSSAINHVAPVAVNPLATAPLVARPGIVGPRQLTYAPEIAGYGLLAPRFGGIPYGGFRSLY